MVAEAARLVDEVGFDNLTLAAVADRFGVALPSLYKHVRGLGGLRRELSVVAITELGHALADAAVGKAGTDALHAIAAAYRDYAHRHPGRYAATVKASDPHDDRHRVASDAVLKVVVAVLAGYQLAGDDAIHATRFLRAALHGFIDLESRGGFGLPQDVERSFALLVDATDEALRSWG